MKNKRIIRMVLMIGALGISVAFGGCKEKTKTSNIPSDGLSNPQVTVASEETESEKQDAQTPASEYDQFRSELSSWSGIELPEDDGAISMTELWIEDGSNGSEGWAEGEGVIGAHFTASDGYFEEAKATITSTMGEPVQEEAGFFVVWSVSSSEVDGTVNELIMDQADGGEIGFKYHKNMPTE